MKYSLLFLMIIATATIARSQLASPATMAAGGNFASWGNQQISYTIGDMCAISTGQNANTSLTQGFQQPDKEQGPDAVSVISQAANAFETYPNPARDQVSAKLSLADAGQVLITMQNNLGQTVTSIYQGNLLKGTHTLTLTLRGLAQGAYSIVAKVTYNNGHFYSQTNKITLIN